MSNIRPEFSTGFHKGDALYRDLMQTYGLISEHWHAGIYLGFRYVQGIGVMLAVQAANGIGWGDTITLFSAVKAFASPTVDVSTTMAQLRDDFVTAFAEGKVGHPFHGSRRTPSLTALQRENIAATASSMLGKNIWYTWVDMLDYKWYTWDGTVNDIDESRCDGVVEYSYEKNNIRVCGGLDGNKWKIANPGIDYPENHNDFHNATYNPGELCPRIQAGDQGNDTALVQLPVIPPAVVDFKVLDWKGFFVPTIWFRIISDSSGTALVRFTVSKNGGPYYFVVTTDPYGSTSPPARVGSWEFQTVPTNTQDRQFGWWMGDTVGGPNYRGQDGTYNFRVVAVDNGGNVSAEQSFSVKVTWPKPVSRQITCISKDERYNPYSRISHVGGTNSDGSKWKITLSEAITEIYRGANYFVEQPAGDRVEVIVAVSEYGHTYLKTRADGDAPNNLLELPECV